MSSHITPASVAKVANLARINSNPDQEFITKFTAELDSILHYVDELKSAQVKVKPHLSRVRTVAQLRADVPDENSDQKEKRRQAIIKQFPNSQGDLLILSGIFNDY